MSAIGGPMTWLIFTRDITQIEWQPRSIAYGRLQKFDEMFGTAAYRRDADV